MAKTITSTIVLKVSGKEVEDSFNGLAGVVKKFERELKNLTPGTKEFLQKTEELKEARERFNKVKEEINAVNEKLNQAPGFLNKLTRGFLDFGDIAKNMLSVNLFEEMFGSAKKAADELLKVSDAMADVRKTTGMTLDEVKNLWDAFDEMDTRTSKMDRLKIAEEAGRLNVPKEEMAEFVQEIDKVYVALGDSYQGGLQQIVGDIGKMKSLFQETNEVNYATAINGIGSALNELAANGVASEKNIADFTMRIGALPNALKPSIDVVMGLGAAFEESGVDSQIAASGYSNFMKVAGENLEAFAKYMNMSFAEAQELFNTRPEEFFLRFAEGMKGVPAEQTTKIFDELKIGTLEVQKAVGVAGDNVDKFRTSIEFANKTMNEASSINQEFSAKNENAAAIIDKLKNAWNEIFTSQTAIGAFDWAIKALGWFTGLTSDAGNGVVIFKERLQMLWDIIRILGSAIIGYQAGLKLTALMMRDTTKATLLQIVADKASVYWTGVKQTAEAARAVVLALLTGNINKAKNAMIAYNSVMKANPIGLLVGLLTTAAAAFVLYSREVDTAGQNQRRFNENMKEAQGEISKEIVALDKLYKAATDASKGKDAQRRATEELQRLYPTVFGNLNQEIIMTGKAETAYKNLRTAILNSARARAAQKMIDQNAQKYADREADLHNKSDQNKKDLAHAQKTKGMQTIEIGGQYFKVSQKEAIAYYKNQQQFIEKAQKDIMAQQEKENAGYLKIVESNPMNNINVETPSPPTGGGNIPFGTSTNRPAKDLRAEQEQKNAQDLTKAKEAHQKALEQTAAEGKKMMELERSLADEKLKLQEESEEKAKEIEKNRYQREWVDLQLRNKDILNEIEKNNIEIEKLQNERNETQSPQAQKEYDVAIAEIKKTNTAKRDLINKNNELAVQMGKTHQKNLLDIELQYLLKKAENEQKAHDNEMRKLLTQNQEKLNALNSLEKAKKEIYKQKADAEQNGEEYRLSEKEIEGIKTIEEAKKVLREDYERQALALQMEHLTTQYQNLEEMYNKVKLQPGFDPEALAKMGEDMEMLKQKMAEVNGQIIGKKEGDEKEKSDKTENAKKEVDILGFSAKDWEDTFKNLETTEGKLKAVAMASKALSNAFSQFGKLQQAIGERDMRRFTRNQEKKKQALLRQLNQGLITQEQYHKAVQNIEDETAEKKRKIQKRAAMWEKAANIAGAISGTALAVVKALATPPPFNIKLAAIVGALGAVQIATIAATPLPEFAEGGFTGKGSGRPDRTGHRPAGIVHESEYVTPKWMLENPVVADVVDWMESIRTGRTAIPKAFAEGGFASMKNEELRMNNDKQTTENPSSEINERLSQTLSEVRDLLSDLKENGVDAFMIEDAENGKRLKRTIKMFEKLEQKNARK